MAMVKRLNYSSRCLPGAVIHHRDISIYLDEAHTSDTDDPLFFTRDRYSVIPIYIFFLSPSVQLTADDGILKSSIFSDQAMSNV